MKNHTHYVCIFRVYGPVYIRELDLIRTLLQDIIKCVTRCICSMDNVFLTIFLPNIMIVQELVACHCFIIEIQSSQGFMIYVLTRLR